MSNKILVLTKVFLKNGSDSLLKRKKKSLPKAISALLLIGILFMSVGIPFGMFVGESYDVLLPLGQQGIILGFALAVISMTVFIFGIFYVLTTFYFSKDIEYLLPLPLKPYEILGAKFITVLIYEYLTEIVFLSPVLVTFGLKSEAGFMYYLYSVIIFLTLPIIPLVISSILNMIIMRFTNLGKHKDALKVFGGLLAMFIGVGFNVFIQKGATAVGQENQLIETLMQGKNSLVAVVTKIFPSAKIASYSLLDATSLIGFENLLIFLLITAIFVVIFMVLAERLYLKGVVGVSETYSKRKRMSDHELDRNLTVNSALKAYTLKEIKILFRTPAFLMNCVIMNFLWPVFIFIPVLTQPSMFKDLDKISGLIKDEKVLAIVLAVGFAISLFVSSTNGITATSISREGQNIFVNKYIPMRYKDQIMAKVLAGVILSGFGILLIIVIAAAFIKPALYFVAMLAVVALIGIIFSAFLGIFIDLCNPKLDWDNEQKAVKNNLNLVINMLLNIIVAVASAVLLIKLQLSLLNAFGVIVIVFGALNILLYKLLITQGEKLFNKIEA